MDNFGLETDFDDLEIDTKTPKPQFNNIVTESGNVETTLEIMAKINESFEVKGDSSAIKENMIWIQTCRRALEQLRDATMPQVGRDGKIVKFIWLCIYIGLFSTFCVSLYKIVDRYLKYPTLIEIEIVSEPNLEFPAVTVCNGNPVRKSLIGRLREFEDLLVLDDYVRSSVMSYAAEAFGSAELFKCPEGYHKCLDSATCIPPFWICNGVKNCNDRSDESRDIHDCASIEAERNENLETWHNHFCVPGFVYCIWEDFCAVPCDGNRECSSGYDESSDLGCFDDSCFETLTATSEKKYITSKNYPENYPPNLDCKWEIHTGDDAGLVVKVTFEDLDTEMTLGGCIDFVELFDGFLNESKVIKVNGRRKTCGNVLPHPPSYFSSGSVLSVRFKSDFFINRKGFAMSFEAVHKSSVTKRSANSITSAKNYNPKTNPTKKTRKRREGYAVGTIKKRIKTSDIKYLKRRDTDYDKYDYGQVTTESNSESSLDYLSRSASRGHKQPGNESHGDDYENLQQPVNESHGDDYENLQQPVNESYGDDYENLQQPVNESHGDDYENLQQPENENHGDDYENIQQPGSESHREDYEDYYDYDYDFHYDFDYDFDYDDDYDYDYEYEYDYDYDFDYYYDYDHFFDINSGDYFSLYKSSQVADFSDFRKAAYFRQETIKSNGHQRHDFIVQCTFNGQDCNPSIFKPFQDPLFGNCFSFNSVRDFNASQSLRVSSKIGLEFGLKLTLFLDLEEHIGIFSHNTGALAMVHDPRIQPELQTQGFALAAGEATLLGIQMEKVQRLGGDYNNCTGEWPDSLLLADDFKEQWPRYSQEACFKYCITNEMASRCNCTDLFDINYSTDDRINFGTLRYCQIINEEQSRCRRSVYSDFRTGVVGCDCGQECLTVEFPYKQSRTPWPSMAYAPYFASKMLKSHSARVVKYMAEAVNKHSQSEEALQQTLRNNFARFQVFYEVLNFRQMTESAAYDTSSLVSDFGGNIGLWLGWSIFVLLELIECIYQLIDAALINRGLMRKHWLTRLAISFPIFKHISIT